MIFVKIPRRTFVQLLAASCLFFAFGVCSAQNTRPLSDFVASDRVLILVPHPDDEAIGTAGVIKRALKIGAQVKLVCYTNGDNNELAFIVYEKRLTFFRGEFLHMGEVRRKETLAAMDSLGLSRGNIIFLGYPDFGTMEIFTKYWGKVKPFKGMLTRVSKVVYPETLSRGAPYVGESILNDIKTVILDFKPNKIFVSHPADINRDHRSLYLFLQIALWDLEKQIPAPDVFPYIIHISGWPKPRGYHPDLELDPYSKLKGIQWYNLELNQEEIQAKHDAMALYKSQIEASPPYLYGFARKNEIFGDFPVIVVKQQKAGEIHWEDSSADEYYEDTAAEKKEEQKNDILTTAYAYQDNNLYLRLTLKRSRDKFFGVSVFLLGYRKGEDFAQMPKLLCSISTLGLHIRDKKEPVFIKDIQLKYEGKKIILKIPLSCLGNPDYILSCARTQAGGLPLEERAWRIIKLE